MNKYCAGVFTAILVVVTLVSCGNDQLSDTSGEQIPIIGYEGVPTKLWTIEGYGLEESYKDMAEAGFTTNIALDISFHRGNPTPEQYFTTLDVACTFFTTWATASYFSTHGSSHTLYPYKAG